MIFENEMSIWIQKIFLKSGLWFHNRTKDERQKLNVRGCLTNFL